MSFIQAIRSAAWKEGKIRDPAWMADFASLYFSHRALAWHSKLPLEIRQDWFKLEASLVDRWAPADPGEDDGWQIQPAPAAAPMRAGLLKVVLDPFGTPPYVQSNASFYVQFDEVESVICTMTVDDSEYSKNLALRVRCNSRSKVGLLEWSGVPGLQFTGGRWSL
ncbi:hypothetical protein M407DRAFT_29080 [Tulasnella calospora MUT 4182]|uniref:Uncharacterized protein n=1 Tax=Tulasnella calospora MUT 4182 TaxID=1051891 RepID=A0A0C3QAS4_9AGAM|nr:hypothetical protein M407DRAFT_29080 [Tulasnella calospora MUT 4182]